MQNTTDDTNTENEGFYEMGFYEPEPIVSNHLPHPPMKCMQQWAKEHGLSWDVPKSTY
jgi:hypothetical protein